MQMESCFLKSTELAETGYGLRTFLRAPPLPNPLLHRQWRRGRERAERYMASERCRYYLRNNWQTMWLQRARCIRRFLGNQNKGFCFVGVCGWGQPRSGGSAPAPVHGAPKKLPIGPGCGIISE